MKKLTQRCVVAGALVLALVMGVADSALAQRGNQQPPQRSNVPATKDGDQLILPLGYVIGPEDVLSVVFWRDKDMSMDVQVRPDGKITLPLINDLLAAGLTPEQLRERLTEEAKKYIEDPTVTIIVKEIRSRRVYISGQVAKQGPFPLSGRTDVLMLLSLAGGVGEYAHTDRIMIYRIENGKQIALKFNYNEVLEGKNLKQNIELKPGDTVVVP